MRKVERFIEIDPVAEWEDRLLAALSDVLEKVPPEDAIGALAAFDALGVILLYDARLMSAKERLKALSPLP